MWTDSLVWKGQASFQDASFDVWKVDGTIGGLVKSSENLTLMQVLNAGHMVPMD
jgi:cathepsin A (carboxypeptidase C)